jgi:hypothetical protein
MGLLDFLNSDDARLGLGLLAAAGPSREPRSFGQRAFGLLGTLDAQKSEKEDREMRRRMQEAQITEIQAQAAQRQAAAEKERRAYEQQQRVQGLLRDRLSPVSPIQANASSGITGPRPEALGAVGQRPAVNWQELIALGVDPKLVAALAEAPNLGRPEVARVEEEMVDGRPVKRQLDKYGMPVGAPLKQWKAPVQMDTGGQVGMIDPVSLQLLAQFQKSQTPDGKASNALGWANFGLSKQREAREGSAPKGQYDPERGLVIDPRTGVAIPVTQGGVPIGPKSKTDKLSEDQGKATGWLSQAMHAHRNMKAALAKTPSAAYPGIPDVIAGIPSLGVGAAVGNWMRGTDRQKFMQASSSLSEAVLRAATGAGVNKDEAEQKVRELTPVWGEDAETTAQKMDSIPVYIESLKVRAGPGAALVKSTTPEGSWGDLGEFKVLRP